MLNLPVLIGKYPENKNIRIYSITFNYIQHAVSNTYAKRKISVIRRSNKHYYIVTYTAAHLTVNRNSNKKNSPGTMIGKPKQYAMCLALPILNLKTGGKQQDNIT